MESHNTQIWASVSEKVILLSTEAFCIHQKYKTLHFSNPNNSLISSTPAWRALCNIRLVWTQHFFHLSKDFSSPHSCSIPASHKAQQPAEGQGEKICPPLPSTQLSKKGQVLLLLPFLLMKLLPQQKEGQKHKLITNHKMLLLKEKGELGEALPRH